MGALEARQGALVLFSCPEYAELRLARACLPGLHYRLNPQAINSIHILSLDEHINAVVNIGYT